ncbi:MAG TPA: glycoside hydrolase family 3 N-terminal domain-containing protein [Ktedonobacterales bacterium]|nr:glycoside hydrolase family 3 N-terminal domain-containing protein [Ktedonobacterales bacterium]
MRYRPRAAHTSLSAQHPRRRAAILVASLLLLLTACAFPGSSGTATAAHPQAAGTPRAATPTPTPDPIIHPSVADTVSWELAHMTLDEKLGQLFLIETGWTTYTQDVDTMVRGMHAGAMIIYQQNMTDPAQLKAYISAVQANATIPLIVSMDEEGGVVDRLGALGFNPPQPAAQDLTASGDPHKAYAAGFATAHEMKWYGINTDLAPVVDVRTNPYAVEYTRIFGDDPTTVDRYAGAYINGLSRFDVIACLKHWPGIGSVALDPHKTLPTIDRSRDQLENTDFAAFRGLLSQQPGMIMVTHVIVNAIDPTMPATLSPKLVNGVLRGELGYQGVVMTDSLYMQGIAERYSLPQAAVLSIEAGDDLLEGAFDTSTMAGMLAALHAAIDSGQISMSRINQSVARILTLKASYGILPLRGSHIQHIKTLPGGLSAGLDADLPHAQRP